MGGVANAQITEPTPTLASDTTAELGDSSKMRAGIVVLPMPLGSFKSDAGSVDTAFAFGIMPTFDFGIGQFLFAGLAPQFIFNVKGKDATGDAAKQLDLRGRIGANAKIADTIRLFGYAAPGYSIIMQPNKPSGQDNPAGFVLGFAGGALMDIAPTTYLSAELGYQLGYQSVDFAGQSLDVKSNFMHVGLGIGFRL